MMQHQNSFLHEKPSIRSIIILLYKLISYKKPHLLPKIRTQDPVEILLHVIRCDSSKLSKCMWFDGHLFPEMSSYIGKFFWQSKT